MRIARALCVAFVALGVMGPAAAVARPAHDIAYLVQGDFAAVETQGTVEFVARRFGEFYGQSASVAYGTQAVTATAGADYTASDGRMTFAADSGCNIGCESYDSAAVSLIDDSVVENLEAFDLELSAPIGTALGTPRASRLTIIDDDGGSRVSFGAATYSQVEDRQTLTIPVYRSGAATQEATVGYALAPGAVDPATPGEDYVDASGTITFPSSGFDARRQFLTVAIRKDERAEADETVSISLSSPSAGTEIAEPAATTLTIIDDEETIDPSSRLHHPKNGRTYARTYYLLREIHVFTTDEGGSRTRSAQIALRKKMKSGACKWWTRGGFTSGSCEAKRWVRMRSYEEQPDFFYYKLALLKPSIRTPVKSYTMFSRAIDGAGNVEDSFVVGRNANTFEVRR